MTDNSPAADDTVPRKKWSRLLQMWSVLESTPKSINGNEVKPHPYSTTSSQVSSPAQTSTPSHPDPNSASPPNIVISQGSPRLSFSNTSNTSNVSNNSSVHDTDSSEDGLTSSYPIFRRNSRISKSLYRPKASSAKEEETIKLSECIEDVPEDVFKFTRNKGGSFRESASRRYSRTKSLSGRRESMATNNQSNRVPPYASFVSRLQFSFMFKSPTPDVEAQKASGHTFHGAVLFADASGFTALTERLAKQPNGAEELCVILNQFFTELITIVLNYGGDIVKFSGDAVTIVWPVDEQQARETNGYVCGTLRAATLRACACSMTLHETLADYVAIDNPDPDLRVLLQLHMGIGAGPLTAVHVGGVFHRWEYIIAGPPLSQISVAEPLARRGQTVVSPEAWELIKDVSWGTAISDQRPELGVNFEPYNILNAICVKVHVPLVPIPEQITEAHAILLRRYIPYAVLPHLELNHDGFVAELRDVSVMFLNILGVNLSATPETLNDVIRNAELLMLELQRNVYAQEGSINKLLVDDKGLLVLCALGLPPMHHVDDAVRAVAAASSLTSSLKQVLGPDVHVRVGVASGRAFCGVVGSRQRREYTLMGDTVNLAVRLMAACQPDEILVDEKTRDLCSAIADNPFEFSRLPHDLELKGKANPVPAFVPRRTHKLISRPRLKSYDPVDCFGRDSELSTVVSGLSMLCERSGGTIFPVGDRGSGSTFIANQIATIAKSAKSMFVFRTAMNPSSAPLSQQSININRSVDMLREAHIGTVTQEITPMFSSWVDIIEGIIESAAPNPEERLGWVRNALSASSNRRDLTMYLAFVVSFLERVFPKEAVEKIQAQTPPSAERHRSSSNISERELALIQVLQRLIITFADSRPTLLILHLQTGTGARFTADKQSWDLAAEISKHCLLRRNNCDEFPNALVLCVVTRVFCYSRETSAVHTVQRNAEIDGLFIRLKSLSEATRDQYSAQVLGSLTERPVRIEGMPPVLLQFLSDRAAGNPRHIQDTIKELVHPDFNAIRVFDNGRVELLRDDLFNAAIPPRMRGAVKQQYDNLPADLQLICRVATFVSAFTPRMVLEILCAVNEMDSTRTQQVSQYRVTKDFEDLLSLGVFRHTAKPAPVVVYYHPRDMFENVVYVFASGLLQEEIGNCLTMQWRQKVLSVIERRQVVVQNAALKITIWARRILNNHKVPERKKLFRAAFTIQRWFRNLQAQGRIRFIINPTVTSDMCNGLSDQKRMATTHSELSEPEPTALSGHSGNGDAGAGGVIGTGAGVTTDPFYVPPCPPSLMLTSTDCDLICATKRTVVAANDRLVAPSGLSAGHSPSNLGTTGGNTTSSTGSTPLTNPSILSLRRGSAGPTISFLNSVVVNGEVRNSIPSGSQVQIRTDSIASSNVGSPLWTPLSALRTPHFPTSPFGAEMPTKTKRGSVVSLENVPTSKLRHEDVVQVPTVVLQPVPKLRRRTKGSSANNSTSSIASLVPAGTDLNASLGPPSTFGNGVRLQPPPPSPGGSTDYTPTPIHTSPPPDTPLTSMTLTASTSRVFEIPPNINGSNKLTNEPATTASTSTTTSTTAKPATQETRRLSTQSAPMLLNEEDDVNAQMPVQALANASVSSYTDTKTLKITRVWFDKKNATPHVVSCVTVKISSV